MGLTFPEIRYEMLDFRTMSAVAAYDGFPVRFPHWRFGAAYDKLEKSYAYGLQRIYECVINTDPCYAYLLESNLDTDQKLVMCHVCGHADFFHNNLWFAGTNRHMLDEMANHASRVQGYMDRYGQDTVEEFIDNCLSIDNLIDFNSAGIVRRTQEVDKPKVPSRFEAKPYMDPFMNPHQEPEPDEPIPVQRYKYKDPTPDTPETDVLLFLLENAPLQNWQYDVLDMIREEAYYFVPQRQTKIANEGWAAFIHSTMMVNKIMEPGDLVDYADHNAGVIAGSSEHFNPYRLGLHIYRDIKNRWDRGAFGQEYDQCTNAYDRKNWDKKLGKGWEQLLLIRKTCNDIGLIEGFMTEDFVREYGMVSFAATGPNGEYVVEADQFKEVKAALMRMLTNGGSPIIRLDNADYGHAGELLLIHDHDGRSLDIDKAKATLKALNVIWGRGVNIYTDGKRYRCFDGDLSESDGF